MTLRVIPGRVAVLDGDILPPIPGQLARKKGLVLFEHFASATLAS